MVADFLMILDKAVHAMKLAVLTIRRFRHLAAQLRFLLEVEAV